MGQLGFALKDESTELGQSEVSQSQGAFRQWKFMESVKLSYYSVSFVDKVELLLSRASEKD